MKNQYPSSVDRARKKDGTSRVVSIALFLSVFVSALSAAETYFNDPAKQATRERTPPTERRYLVDVGSRVILPQKNKAVAFKNNRAFVYLQFNETPNAKERAAVERLGVKFYGAVSPNTYLVKITEDSQAKLAGHLPIRAMEPVEPPDKLTANLYYNIVGRHVRQPDGTLAVHVRFYEDVSLAQALSALDGLAVRVVNRERMLFNNRLLVHATFEQIQALSAEASVTGIEEIPPRPRTDNVTAAQLSNVDDVQATPFNLDGNGVIMGIWDEGPVRVGHPDLTPRVTVVENANTVGDHSTHVAGTMISSGANNANARGMAPAAGQLFSYDFDGDPTTEQNDAVVNRAIRIANHSWGPSIGWADDGTDDGNTGLFGSYNGTARDWDALVRTRGLIVCKSSGNDRNDCNPMDGTDCDGVLGADGQRYDTIGAQGVSKNVITVGAINDDGTTIAGFSSSGPADDGRIKPDVVANGVGLTSTWNGGTTIPGGCDGMDYCSISGTSMSTPAVSGICALLVQRYRQEYANNNPSPDIIKALLVNTATDLGRPGPDYLFGYGLVNALAAVQTIDVGPVRIVTGSVDNGDTDEYLIGIPAGQGTLRVTLNWIDPAGAANNGGNDIVNNLDLEIVGPDNVVRFPFTGPGMTFTANATTTGPNNIDTLEQVVVNAPQQGFWKVRVKGTGVPSGPQNYALVANASFTLDDQPDLRIAADLDFDLTCPGENRESVVTIFNIGGADLLVHSVSVVAGAPNFTLLPNPTQPFIVRPGDHVDLIVRFAPNSPGAKAGTLRIVSNDADQGQVDLPMTGTGGQPTITTAIPNSGNFGNVCVGSFKDLPLTINNAGSCDLLVNNITSSSGDFVVPGVITYPIVVHPGDSVAVPIRFQPGTIGAKAGTITITSSDPNAPTRQIAVSGTAPTGDIRVTGSTDFGNVCAGGPVAEKTVSICNLGLCDLRVFSVSVNCPDFTIVNNPFPGIISHDFCVDVVIRFTPTSCGPKTCTLTIISDDPDSPTNTLTLTANTPCPDIDVPPDLGFLPEVVQTVGTCKTLEPFPISNKGECNLIITAITIGGPDAGDFALSGLPSFPIILQPGHIAGEGDLNVVFAPTVVDRDRVATITVTYVTDPITGSTTNVTRLLCGEGVRTGARVLVTHNGIPVAKVEKIHLQRITSNRNRDRLDSQDVAMNLPLTTVLPAFPCPPFQYHREYGTVSNPIQLVPGSYQVTATAVINGKRKTLVVGFDVQTCDFNPTVVVDF